MPFLCQTVEPLVSDHLKCQALVVPYQSLDHVESKFDPIRMW